MDATKPENKAKANEKAELTIVSEHFEAVFRRAPHLILWRVNAVIWLRSIHALTNLRCVCIDINIPKAAIMVTIDVPP